MKFGTIMALAIATSITAFSAGNLFAGGDKQRAEDRQQEEGLYQEGEARQDETDMEKLRGTGRDIMDSSRETGRQLMEDVRGIGDDEEEQIDN
jgi:hypothetical protein